MAKKTFKITINATDTYDDIPFSIEDLRKHVIELFMDTDGFSLDKVTVEEVTESGQSNKS